MKNNVFNHKETAFDKLLDIRQRLPEFLSGHRLSHTLSVELEAVGIAKTMFEYLGIDDKYLYDISAAALLHDITKQFDAERQQELCKKHSLQYKNDGVLHSHTGAYFARDEFGINDAVFNAIYTHTTGCEDMDVFQKILFIADYIEKTRTHRQCTVARKFYYDNIEKTHNKMEILDKTILMSLGSTLDFLHSNGLDVDEQTSKAQVFLLAECALQYSAQE